MHPKFWVLEGTTNVLYHYEGVASAQLARPQLCHNNYEAHCHLAMQSLAYQRHLSTAPTSTVSGNVTIGATTIHTDVVSAVVDGHQKQMGVSKAN